VSAVSHLDRRTDGGAIASLVLGIVGFFVFPVVPSILAVCFGLSAKRRIRRDPGLGGQGLATAGVILGVVELVLVAAAVVLLVLLAWNGGGLTQSPLPLPPPASP
jgi:Domain of unknown function (DUF4190)